jgi:hypothetical protein
MPGLSVEISYYQFLPRSSIRYHSFIAVYLTHLRKAPSYRHTSFIFLLSLIVVEDVATVIIIVIIKEKQHQQEAETERKLHSQFDVCNRAVVRYS